MKAKLIQRIFGGSLPLLLPAIALAQFTGGGNEISTLGQNIINFINDVLVPLVFAIALLLFIYGVFVYFIQGGGDDGKREAGKGYILWAVIALVVMVSVWGITNLIAGGLGLDDPDAINDLIPSADVGGGGGN